MVNDVRGLEILCCVVEDCVVFSYVVFPNVVCNGVILGKCEVFLKLVIVLVGEDEVHRSAVFDSVEDGLIDVAFHVCSGAGEYLRSVVNHTEERNGL